MMFSLHPTDIVIPMLAGTHGLIWITMLEATEKCSKRNNPFRVGCNSSMPIAVLHSQLNGSLESVIHVVN